MPNLHMPTNSGVLGMWVKQPWRQTYLRLLVLTHNAKMYIEDEYQFTTYTWTSLNHRQPFPL